MTVGKMEQADGEKELVTSLTGTQRKLDTSKIPWVLLTVWDQGYRPGAQVEDETRGVPLIQGKKFVFITGIGKQSASRMKEARLESL